MTVGQEWVATHLAGDWQATSSSPDVVRVEVIRPELPGGDRREDVLSTRIQVYCKALKPGWALIVASNRKIGQVEVWRIQVEQPVAPPDAEMLKAVGQRCACRTLEPASLRCGVPDRPCLEQLRACFSNAVLTTEHVELSFSIPALQALLADMQKELAGAGMNDVQVSFSGVNLTLDGKLPADRFHDLLRVLYRVMVGRLLVVDRLEDQAEARNSWRRSNPLREKKRN